MKQDRIESNTRQSGGQPVGQREHLLDALRECYGIANREAEHQIREFEARYNRPSGSGSNPVAALLQKPLR